MTAILKLFPSWAWLVLGGAVLATVFAFGCRQGAAGPRLELAEYKAAQAEAGRLAAQSRTREEAAARAQEGQWQAGYDQGARDGQKALDDARADGDRATAALDRVRKQLAAFRSAVGRATADSGAATPGPAAGAAAGVSADMLERLAARVERLGGRAGVYARFADAAHAAGNTCQRSADALTAPAGVTLFK